MTDRSVEASPQIYARIGGALYLFIIVAGLFAEAFVRDKLTVSGDAAATAANIMASTLLWRISIAGELIMLVCAVALALILYVLLKPVSKNLALLAAFFNLVEIAADCANKANLFAALSFLGSADYLKAFEPQQLHALAYLALKSHTYGYNISLIFFGVTCFIWGYLIFKSGYFPKILGVLLIIVSACYLTNSFAWLLAPKFANMIFPAILVPAFIGESSLCLWLIVNGVNVPKWKEQVTTRRALEGQRAIK
jgi:hypothetical protein